jgi:hypothetical protein
VPDKQRVRLNLSQQLVRLDQSSLDADQDNENEGQKEGVD